MKKLFFAVLMMTVLLSLPGLFVSALQDGNFYYTVNSDGTATITDIKNANTELNIPSTIGGRRVTKIGNGAFWGCTKLTGDLIIPDGVTEIGSDAFFNCMGLKGKLVIPTSVKTIGDAAFYGCSGLTGELELPSELTTLGMAAFYCCSSLTGELIFPKGIKTIPDGVFGYCEGLTGDLVILAGMTVIGDSAFSGCKGFTGALVIPEGVTTIRENAFSYCTGLTGDLIIPEGVTGIGSCAFYQCSSLTGDLLIPESVKAIGSSAFYGCSGLSEAYFYGDVPSEWGNDVLKNTASDFTIYYLEGKSGWTSPAWTSPDGIVYNTKVLKQGGDDDSASSLRDLTEVDYLALSSLVYRDCQEGKTVYDILAAQWDGYWDEAEITNSRLYQNLRDWKVLTMHEVPHTGFYAAAFVNDMGETVIAYRGSSEGNLENWLNDPDWGPNDFKMFFTGQEGEQVKQAFSFYEKVSGMTAGKEIAVTGHSLGGGLADMVAARYGLSGRSFNSAPFLDVAYWHYPEEMAKHFEGVNAYRFIAHVNELDLVVGNWPEAMKPKLVHQNNEYGTDVFSAHSLRSMVEKSEDGTLRLTPVLRNEVPQDSVTQGADASKTQWICLGTLGIDSLFRSDLKLMNRYYVFAGRGNDSITGATMICGGPGNDMMDGGFWGGTIANNTYIYWKGQGVDTIRDIDGTDTLLLCGFDESDAIFVNTIDSEDYILIQLNGETIINIHRDRNFFGGTFTVKGANIVETDITFWMRYKEFADLLVISCPVDIEILDANGNVVYTVKDAEEGAYYTEYGNFYVYKEENGEYGKFLRMIEGYTVRIVGVGEGTMDVQVQAAADDGSLLPVQSLEAVPVTATTTATVEKDTQNNASLHVDTDGDSQTDSTLTLTYTLESNASSALTFTEDGYVRGISAGLTAADLAACFATEAIRITDSNGVVLASDAGLKTLYRIELLAADGKTVLDEATILVTCDINCDGESNVLDLLRTRQLIENNEITDWEKMIADLNESGAPDVYDLIDMIKTILA